MFYFRHVLECSWPQGGGALGGASTPGTPAGSMAASAHGGTYSHVAVVGGRGGGETHICARRAAQRAQNRSQKARLILGVLGRTDILQTAVGLCQGCFFPEMAPKWFVRRDTCISTRKFRDTA